MLRCTTAFFTENEYLLTAAAKYDCHPLGGGGVMTGSYHWHEPAKRFYVSVYHDRKRYLNLRQQDITHHYDLTFYGVEDI